MVRRRDVGEDVLPGRLRRFDPQEWPGMPAEAARSLWEAERARLDPALLGSPVDVLIARMSARRHAVGGWCFVRRCPVCGGPPSRFTKPEGGSW